MADSFLLSSTTEEKKEVGFEKKMSTEAEEIAVAIRK